MPLLEKFKSWMRAEDETDFPSSPPATESGSSSPWSW